MEWSEWLQDRMDERGLVPYTLAMRITDKLKASGRVVHASSIQRQLSGARGIQSQLANDIALGLDLPQEVVQRAAGLLGPDPRDVPDNPKFLVVQSEVRDIKDEADLDALLLLIRAFKAGRGGGESKKGAVRKAGTGRTRELAAAG